MLIVKFIHFRLMKQRQYEPLKLYGFLAQDRCKRPVKMLC